MSTFTFSTTSCLLGLLGLLAAPAAMASSSIAQLDGTHVHGPACNSTPFSSHTCHVKIANMSSPSITTAAQCLAACCAATKFTCNVAQWCAPGAGCATPGCFGGDSRDSPRCERSHGWENSFINAPPSPPGPKPPTPTPPPPPPPKQPPFSFADAVGNGMVLAAAPKQAMVWGFCAPGASVSVGFNGQTVAATVGPDQATGTTTTWRALLPATAASFANHTITATSAGTTLTLTGVMFGEVWICSGQSNMEYPIGSPTCWNASNINCTDHTRGDNTEQCGFGCTQNAGAEIAAMVDYDDGIRLFTMGGGSSPSPKADGRGAWNKPSKVGGGFSATCWYYGRDVYNAMSPKVPVGLVATDVGGTPDQHWSSPEALDKCRGPESWQWAADFKDSVLWNAMVVPLLRTVHSGIIWYQGENNAAYPRRYNCSFPAMIGDWRAKWSKFTDGATAADFPFGWAQLNSCGNDHEYKGEIFNPAKPPSTCGHGCTPECNTTCLGRFHEWGDYNQGFTGIRYAQDNTLAAVTNTFQAVIIDTPVASGSIHSPFKQPVGRRLARGGLDLAYGMKAVHAVDPSVKSAVLVGGSVVITLQGLGTAGINVAVGSYGFEVLGKCAKAPPPGSCDGPCLCWASVPIGSATATTVTLSKPPQAASAVRYLWYIAPYGTQPFVAPVYALGAAPLPGVNASMSNPAWDRLPLGPFILPL